VQQQGVDSIKAGAAQQAGSSANSVPSTSGQQQQQQQGVTVQVAGLVATQSVEQAVQSARDLVAAGHTALKIKVARR
jgi:cytochrome c-type biogenesis protein CcmE